MATIAEILAADFVIKRNDQREALRGTIKQNGNPVDLTTANAIHIYLYTEETEAKTTRRIKTGTVIVLDAVNGRVEYLWEADDLVKAGLYLGEFEITWDDGTPQTYPNGADGKPYFTIGVPEDLGPIEPEE